MTTAICANCQRRIEWVDGVGWLHPDSRVYWVPGLEPTCPDPRPRDEPEERR